MAYIVPPVRILPDAHLKAATLHISVQTHRLQEARLLVRHVITLARSQKLDVDSFALVFENNLTYESSQLLSIPSSVVEFCPSRHAACSATQAFCILALRQLSDHFRTCQVASVDAATDGAYMWQYSGTSLKIWHEACSTEFNFQAPLPVPDGMSFMWSILCESPQAQLFMNPDLPHTDHL